MAAPLAVRSTIVDLPPFGRAAEVSKGIDIDARTVPVVFSTGAPVKRFDWWTGKSYIEKLSMDPGAIMLDRLNNGGPLLNAHSAWSIEDQIGVVEDDTARIEGKKAVAVVRFSKRDDVEKIFRDVVDRIVRKVSVGYIIHKFEEEAGEDGAIPTRTATRWEPYEISMVPMPADANAQVRAAIESARAEKRPPTIVLHSCEIISRATPAHTPESPTMSLPITAAAEIAENNPLLDPPAPTPPAAAEPTDREAGALAERTRTAKIRKGCKALRMSRDFETRLIESGLSAEECQTQIMEEYERRGGDTGAPNGGAAPRVEFAGDDPLIHARNGIVNALLNRVNPGAFPLEEIGKKYRGMSVLDIGRAFITARGNRVSHLSKDALVDVMLQRTGYHTTSDFPNLFEDAANKNLRAAYEAAPQTWRPLARPVTVTDFKPSRQLQISDAPALDEVLEHGEFLQGTIAEGKEVVQLKTYGKMFAITRQALINDDLNAFGTIPAAFGRKARDKESDLAWEQITNAALLMGDGLALFHTTHGNLSGTSDAIATASLGAARAALRIQKGVDGVTLLNLEAAYLIVPAAKETIADQNVTQITPALPGSVNPFAAGGRTPLTVIVEPRLDTASTVSWYIATRVDQAPVLYYATLDGQPGPDVRQQEGFRVDGMQFRCRMDVAFKAADWRAIFKNPGA